MKTLSVRPPWAWMIMCLPGPWKNVENRSWSTRYRGPLLIHSSGKLMRDDFESALGVARAAGAKSDDLPSFATLQARRGGIVGAVMLTSVLDPGADDGGPWFDDCNYGFLLAGRFPLPFRPMLGKLNLYETPLTPTEAEALAEWQQQSLPRPIPAPSAKSTPSGGRRPGGSATYPHAASALRGEARRRQR